MAIVGDRRRTLPETGPDDIAESAGAFQRAGGNRENTLTGIR